MSKCKLDERREDSSQRLEYWYLRFHGCSPLKWWQNSSLGHGNNLFKVRWSIRISLDGGISADFWFLCILISYIEYVSRL